ncbi:hypothetical protein [Actinomyces oris]|uniref:hypothetical protein n=1 Tax=Actinomyces oris TaxID=544580 RepID=UPI0028D83545|nr:hypothetical protein [Actinomyces oris]
MLTINTCHYHRSLDSTIGLKVTSLDLSTAESIDSAENPPNLTSWKNSIAGDGYYITGVSQFIDEGTGAEPPSLSVFGRRSSDKGIVWATQIRVNDFTHPLDAPTHPYSSSEQSPSTKTTALTNDWTLSPNGKYVAFKLNSSTKATAYFAVVETSTGRVVQTTHITRRIIGVALTDTHLAVETSDQPFPGDSGNATLTILSLLNQGAPPVTTPTTQWLIGASHKSFLLSNYKYGDPCIGDHCTPMTVSRIDGAGQTIDTVSGVIDVYSGGWMSRFSDPAAASSLLAQIYDPIGIQERQAANEQLRSIRRELVDPDSGQHTDITDLLMKEVSLPTGPGLLALKQIPSDDAYAKYVSVFWLSSTDDGHPHTENLEQFTDD